MEDRTAPIERAVADVLAGNTEAYSLIVTTYMQKLHRTALYLCRSESDAEDLVQETLIDGFMHLGNLRDPAKLEAWLMQILKYKALRLYRRRDRIDLMEEPPDLIDHATPAGGVLHDESLREWRHRLESLSPTLRDTAILYFWHDLSMEEIAKRTKIPLGTIKSRIHAARVALRDALRKEQPMSDNRNTLSDGFAEAVEKKITELQNYHKLYGSHAGFDAAYRNLKELIANLSDRESMRKYATRTALIASMTDLGAYGDEALATCRQWNEPGVAADIYFKRYAAHGDAARLQADFIRNVALPDLEDYPDSPAKENAVGYMQFWLGCCLLELYTEKTSTSGMDEIEAVFRASHANYMRAGIRKGGYGMAAAAVRSLPYFRAGEDMASATLTGEIWHLHPNGQISYKSQPGFGMGGPLQRYRTPVFYSAGYAAGSRFFPTSMSFEAGTSETMFGQSGDAAGTCEVVSASETVSTPAGTFEDCVHIRKTECDHSVYDIWYKDGVGLLKLADPADSPFAHKVLVAYEVHGGSGLLPVATGNRWCYQSPALADGMTDVNEYIMENTYADTDGDGNPVTAVALSCLNYMGMQSGWAERVMDPALVFGYVSDLCEKKEYVAAADALSEIILSNTDRESVDDALSILDYLREKARYDRASWRFCPSSANISGITLFFEDHHRIGYNEAPFVSCDTGVWGSRGEENRIFGVKPFRYLQALTGTLWDDRWVPGYESDVPHSWRENVTTHIRVVDGGRVETPAGVFENTIRITLTCGETHAPAADYYFFHGTDLGEKDYWFAEGVGIVRFDCRWGSHLQSECVLTDCRVTARTGDRMPIAIGNRWRYEEVNLTGEGYIARRDYGVLSGRGKAYRLADHQMFTFMGNVEAYEEMKQPKS